MFKFVEWQTITGVHRRIKTKFRWLTLILIMGNSVAESASMLLQAVENDSALCVPVTGIPYASTFTATSSVSAIVIKMMSSHYAYLMENITVTSLSPASAISIPPFGRLSYLNPTPTCSPLTWFTDNSTLVTWSSGTNVVGYINTQAPVKTIVGTVWRDVGDTLEPLSASTYFLTFPTVSGAQYWVQGGVGIALSPHSIPQYISIDVRDASLLGNDPSYSQLDGYPASLADLALTINCNPPGHVTCPLPIQAEGLLPTLGTPPATASHGSVSVATDPDTGVLTMTYTPNIGFVGTDAVTVPIVGYNYITTLPTAVNATATITINVGDIPSVASGGTLTVTENTATTGALHATDPAGNPITYAVGTRPSHGTVNITNASTGAYTYTPTGSYTGSDSFTYTVTDQYGSSTATVTINVQPPIISLGSGGMTLSGSTLSLIAPSANPLTIGSCDGSLDNPLTISAPITAPTVTQSTGLNPGGVIRINGTTNLGTVGYTTKAQAYEAAHPGSLLSGFTLAFGMPAPIWGYNPWVIITPPNSPAYAFRPAGSTGTLGWADGIAPNNGSITGAIVLDSTSLTVLVAATNASNLSAISGTPSSVASKSGIVSHGGPTGQGGTWNIGVNACGTSGFSVPGSSLQALIAATNGGQLVVANGATIS